jgi:hypothetical protein
MSEVIDSSVAGFMSGNCRGDDGASRITHKGAHQ